MGDGRWAMDEDGRRKAEGGRRATGDWRLATGDGDWRRTYTSVAPQAQRVCDHGERAEGHRGASPDRADQWAAQRIQDTGGHRYADGVVGEGEEQILADVAHRVAAQAAGAQQRAQVTLDQRDARTLHRDVGAG